MALRCRTVPVQLPAGAIELDSPQIPCSDKRELPQTGRRVETAITGT